MVLAALHGIAGRAYVCRDAGPVDTGLGADGRKLLGTLDAIDGTRFLNAEHGGPQIAIIVQR
jgi:hypothetical protein